MLLGILKVLIMSLTRNVFNIFLKKTKVSQVTGSRLH